MRQTCYLGFSRLILPRFILSFLGIVPFFQKFLAIIFIILIGCGWLTNLSFVFQSHPIILESKDLMKIAKVIFHIKPIFSYMMRM